MSDTPRMDEMRKCYQYDKGSGPLWFEHSTERVARLAEELEGEIADLKRQLEEAQQK